MTKTNSGTEEPALSREPREDEKLELASVLNNQPKSHNRKMAAYNSWLLNGGTLYTEPLKVKLYQCKGGTLKMKKNRNIQVVESVERERWKECNKVEIKRMREDLLGVARKLSSRKK